MREEKVTQESLGSLVDVSRQAVGHYMQENNRFPSDWIAKWANAYGLSDSEITRLFLFKRRGEAV